MSTEKLTILDVQGMTCGSCVRHVQAALRDLYGVENVSVALGEGKVHVTHAADGASVGAMIGALAAAGYPSRLTGT